MIRIRVLIDLMCCLYVLQIQNHLFHVHQIRWSCATPLSLNLELYVGREKYGWLARHQFFWHEPYGTMAVLDEIFYTVRSTVVRTRYIHQKILNTDPSNICYVVLLKSTIFRAVRYTLWNKEMSAAMITPLFYICRNQSWLPFATISCCSLCYGVMKLKFLFLPICFTTRWRPL